MRQYELDSKAMSYTVLVQLCVKPGNDFSLLFFKKILSSFPCSSKIFLNFGVSSTRLLIEWFLIKKDTCTVV